MIKDKKGDKARLYRGYYKPAGLAAKDKKIDGWHNETADEFPATFNTTYNDTADVVVKGKTLQKSEWVHKTGESTQANPLTNILPENRRKFEGWTAHQGASVTLTQNISVPEWNTDEATRVQISGGTSTTKYLISAGINPTDRKVQSRIYIKNVGTANVRVRINQPAQWGDYPAEQVIGVGQTAFIVLNGVGNGVNVWQLQFSSQNIDDNLDIIAYDPRMIRMDDEPMPDNPFPITSNLPAGTYKVQDHKGDFYEFTLDEDLRGIDDVRDSVEWDKYSPSVGRLEKRYGKKIFDGKENWFLTASEQTPYCNDIRDIIARPVTNNNVANAFVTHYPVVNRDGLSGRTYPCAAVSTLGSFIIWDRENGITVNDYKAYLSSQHANGTPVTVVYQLATPTRTPLTFTLNNSSTAPECPMEFLTDTPSLEYPAEVFDASGTVKVRGKNLFNPSQWETPTTDRGVTVTYLPDEDCFLLNGTVTATGGIAIKTINLSIVKGSIFSISTKYISGAVTRPTGSEYAVAYFGADDTIDSSVNWASCHLQNTDTVRENVVCDYNYVTRFWFYCSTGVSFDNYKIKIQLEQNQAATSYEPYRPEVSAPIPPLRSNADGTVCDEFEVKTGKLTRKIGRIESYNGEDVGDDWISSTGALDTGATVEYVLAEPIEEQYTPGTLPTYYPTTVIEIDNHSPASVEEAEVEVKVQDVWEE